jgi:hypothetical protein
MKLASKVISSFNNLKEAFTANERPKAQQVLKALEKCHDDLDKAIREYAKIDQLGASELENIAEELLDFIMHISIGIDDEMEEAKNPDLEWEKALKGNKKFQIIDEIISDDFGGDIPRPWELDQILQTAKEKGYKNITRKDLEDFFDANEETYNSNLEEAEKKTASESDKSKNQGLNKKVDELDAKKAKLLDQLSKEADDDKRSKVQDELHATREQIQKINDQRKAMLNKFRGLKAN